MSLSGFKSVQNEMMLMPFYYSIQNYDVYLGIYARHRDKPMQ